MIFKKVNLFQSDFLFKKLSYLFQKITKDVEANEPKKYEPWTIFDFIKSNHFNFKINFENIKIMKLDIYFLNFA